jgi:FkbM family methyltransferase
MKTDSKYLSGFSTSAVADFARRGRCIARALVGRDVYRRPQLRARKELLGGRPVDGYGAWTICPEGLTSKSIVYSIGVGDDISFEISLIQEFALPAVFAFDPTPTSISWLSRQRVPNELKLFEYAISDYDGTARFFPHDNPVCVAHSLIPREATAAQAVEVQVRSLPTVMAELGHSRIDLLKMDIEGAEYDVIDTLVSQNIEVHQLLVDFHHLDRFTAGMSPARTKDAIRKLNRAGLKIFNVTPSGQEYSFIRT